MFTIVTELTHKYPEEGEPFLVETKVHLNMNDIKEVRPYDGKSAKAQILLRSSASKYACNNVMMVKETPEEIFRNRIK